MSIIPVACSVLFMNLILSLCLLSQILDVSQRLRWPQLQASQSEIKLEGKKSPSWEDRAMLRSYQSKVCSSISLLAQVRVQKSHETTSRSSLDAAILAQAGVWILAALVWVCVMQTPNERRTNSS